MNDKIQPWKTRSSKMAFDHKWFKVRQDEVELPNGTVLDDYFVWVHAGVSLVVPVTEDGNFILVRQYKHGAGKVVIEFPAGYVDAGESTEQAAVRELMEETGYASEEFLLLTDTTNNPTKEDGRNLHLFLAKNVVKKHDTKFDDNEEIETLICTPSEVLEKISSGEIWVTGSVAAGMLALTKLGFLTTPKN